MNSFPERQYDIPRSRAFWLSVPHFIPGRINATDYVFFNYDCSFPADKYRVLVESMSNASPSECDRFRDIGPLERKVELPDVEFGQGFGSHAKILVLPLEEGMGLKSFVGNLVRGSTYTISVGSPRVTNMGHYAMNRTGVH